MIGTSAMYEYAAMAIGPSNSGFSLEVRKIAVGPSAPPIMPMLPAAFRSNPRKVASTKGTKMPICAAAPSRRLDGLAMSGPKSVIAPTPRKMSGG